MVYASSAALAQQVVGTVEFSKGAVSAQVEGGSVRLLGREAEVFATDEIKTASRSFVVIKFIDGTRMTLRPDTTFVVGDVNTEDGQENAVFRLVKGGFRVLTGLISKAVGGVFKVDTPVATIGVRGTEFDARLCQEGEDCEAVSRGQVAARFVEVNGELTILADTVANRSGAVGESVYVGDELVSGVNSYAVVAFRDGSVVTIQPNTRFRIEEFNYRATDESSRNIFLRVLVGGFRVLTGAIGKLNPQGFRIDTPTATIGVRGTGFDVLYNGETHVKVWENCINLSSGAGALDVCQGQSGFNTSLESAPALTDSFPAIMESAPGPRPDSINVDINNLFGAATEEDGNQRLYVSVSDGVVVLDNGLGSDALDVGQSQSAVVTETGEIVLLPEAPPFMLQDTLPRPAEINDRLLQMFDLIQANQSPFIQQTDGLECRVN